MDYNFSIFIIIVIVSCWASPSLLEANNDQSSSASTIYQPTKQEIDRFHLIQEQIRHHQQEEQRERERKKHFEQQEMDRRRLEQQQIQPRHPAESLLIPHSALVPMFMQRQQIYSDHRVPMPPQPPPPYLQQFGGFSGGGYLPQSMAPPPPNYHPQMIPEPQMNQFGQNILPYNNDVENRNSRIQMMNHHQQQQHNRKQFDKNVDNRPEDENDFEKIDRYHGKVSSETMDTTDMMSESPSRFDKNRHHHHNSIDVTNRYRCYSCQWNIAHCSDFNCYNNPDICTTNNFVPNMVQQADCPGGCEQFVITDPNGLTQQWKRGCAQPGSFPIVRMRCNTYYEFGVRIDRCVCNNDWCNRSSTKIIINKSIILFIMAIIIIIIF